MPPSRLIGASCLAALLLAAPAPAPAVTATGRLQIIHLDVGQGDGAVIISPLGQVVMIDDGVNGNPTPACGVKVPQQLQALGVTHVDYHFSSHYHSDHLGLFKTIFGAGGIATVDYGWDRGGSYSTSYYTDYNTTLGSKRRTLVKNQVITLDSLSAHPVRIKCVDLNAAGISTTDENSLSVQLKVTYGEFDMSFGGDTPGANSGSYKNVETTVGPEMGPIEVYKVHHHGSATSSLTDWLNATKPKIAVISEGTGNTYGHPTSAALTRLHNAGVHTYWTETGSGAAPTPGWDKVSNGQIVISATWEPGGVDTIRGNGFADTFTNSGTPTGDTTPPVVAVGAPNGGEDWKAGSAQAITWTASDDVGVTAVDLAYSTDGGASFPNSIATGLANSGSYLWTVPDAPGTSVRVRVRARDAAGNLGADSSATGFTISTWTITATAGANGSVSPSGAVAVAQGASQRIAIAPAAGYRVGSVIVDGNQVAADTSYTFSNVSANHTLSASFADAAAPAVVVTAPVGGERWAAGSEQTIRWTASDNVGVDSVAVEYSLVGVEGPWLTVGRGLANTGSCPWTLPEVGSENAWVRVTAYDGVGNAGSGTSDSAFVILSGTAAVGERGAPVLALGRPQPNPGTGATWLGFSLPAAGRARLEILDASGRRLWAREGDYAAGAQGHRWDGRTTAGGRLGAGLYFVRLVTPWGQRTQRLVWLP